MTSQSIYKSVLLPDILDYCQVFFPSLMEQSQRQHPNTAFPSELEIRNSLNQFIEWLQRCLEAPLTQVSDNSQRSPGTLDTQNLVTQFTQYLNLSTDSGITPNTNPLAQHCILDTLDKILTINSDIEPSPYLEAIEQKFDHLAESFYKQLNRFCGCYFSMSTDSLSRDLPKPKICLDSNAHFPALERSSPSISDVEAAIQSIKQFINEELNQNKVGTKLHALAKKIALPIINCSLTIPEAFLAHDTKHPLKQLLLDFKAIAQHCHHYRTAHSNEMSSQTEMAIKYFISSALEGPAKTNETRMILAPLVKQCVAPQPTAPEKRTEAVVPAPSPKASNPATDNQTTSNTGKVITLPSRNKVHTFSSIKEQAGHMIKTLLLDTDTQNSLAAKLQYEWLRILELTGNRYGTHSTQWEQAIQQFIELTSHASIAGLPPLLARNIEKQLRLTGVRNAQISGRAHPPAEAQYTSILKEGNWFYYNRDDQEIRCKLAAIIKQIGRYIFISRQGQKVLEIDHEELKTQLTSGRIRPCRSASLSNTLEDVLSNIKHAQTKELELDY